MCSALRRALGVTAVLLIVAGCAPPVATSPPGPRSDAPSNFAAPEDLLHRYPTMRRQQL